MFLSIARFSKINLGTEHVLIGAKNRSRFRVPSDLPTTVWLTLQQFRRALKTYLFGWLRLQQSINQKFKRTNVKHCSHCTPVWEKWGDIRPLYMPGNDCEKRQVLSSCINVDSVTDDVTSPSDFLFVARYTNILILTHSIMTPIVDSRRFSTLRVFGIIL